MTEQEILIEFQKRQKRIALAACACFVVMVPLTLWARSINPFIALGVILGFLLPMLVFYFSTYRCPACGKLVKQRRRRLSMSVRCVGCNALLQQ